RIKSKVENTRIAVSDQRSVGVTISMGISSYNGHPGYKPENLIREADLALYRSKNSGRNLVTVFDPVTKEFTSLS
ncbi:MAG: diguanylate cyclase, partial [Candidatus Omnitrophica bacterium]|nr:diguanylate cyclase [Candidatus Omnitrophota bacterium]